MSGDSLYVEDLRQLAADAADVARRHCGSCQNMHLLWPYLRLTRATDGCSGADLIQAALKRLVAEGGRRILIAGAADTGVLAVVAQAVAPENAIVVLDRCETPLELCRRFARHWSLSIDTRRVDLLDFAAESEFDVALAHSLLQFIAPEHRVDVLSRLRRSLRPNGRLIITFRRSARIEGSLLPEYRESYPKNLLERLDDMNIVLPEPRAVFLRRVKAYSEERALREGAHRDRADVEQLIKAAGFLIESITAIESTISTPFKKFADKLSKQRFLAVAKPA